MNIHAENFAEIQSALMGTTGHIRSMRDFDPAKNPFHAQVLKHLTTAHKYFVAAQGLRNQNKSYDALEPAANAAMYLHAANQELAKTSMDHLYTPVSETARISKVASKLANSRGQ